MREIQASEAKTHLARLLDEVEHGESIVITRDGRPIARLIPAPRGGGKEVADAFRTFAELRRRVGGMSREDILSARNEGRTR